MEYNMAKQKMKKVIVLVSALMLGFAVSASAQDNRSTSTQSPRETHNVSSRPASQSPRETRANSYSESNSRRPSVAPSQQSNSRQQSSPRTTSSSSNNNDRIQRDATKSSQYQYGKPRN